MKKKQKHILLALIILLTSLFMGIGYAAFNSVTLDIRSKVSLMSEKKIFISNVEVYEYANAIATINLYDGTYLSSSIQLANDENTENSFVTFAITIKNNSPYKYGYVGPTLIIGEDTYDNENIIFEISNIEENEEIESGRSKTFLLTFKYNNTDNISSNELNSKLNFKFKNLSGMKLNELILMNEESYNSGLYSYNDKYYFGGTDVNNYIWFNCESGYTSGEDKCEKWRIVSIENDGSIKITKDNVVESSLITELENTTNFWLNETKSQWVRDSKILAQGKVIFDYKNLRPKNDLLENGYCIIASNGCNAYSSNQNMVGTYQGLNVDEDSLIKKYLDNVYYIYGLTDIAKEQIKEYNLSIGLVSTGLNIETILKAEKSIITSSYVGLLNISDYIFTSNDNNCKNDFNRYYNSSCKSNNWMWIDQKQYILINGKSLATNDRRQQIWTIRQDGAIYSQDATNEYYLRPVVVLDKTRKAIGTGRPSDAYIILY
ncbi:MAG: hypothetical protein E7167_03805 [Firmicutes bacterium]|nr:hypothetical protein [Bacillota bacterium]